MIDMPFINVKTNAALDSKTKNEINNRLSDAISLIPGKSDGHLMCAVEDGAQMMFHRDGESKMAFVEVKILGSSTKEAYTAITGEICSILSELAGIDGSYCYVKFEEVKLWGHNGYMF